MIRIPPQHNTTHPPGQVVNPINQEKTLAKEIEEYKKIQEMSDFHMTRRMETHKEEYRKKVQNGDFT